MPYTFITIDQLPEDQHDETHIYVPVQDITWVPDQQGNRVTWYLRVGIRCPFCAGRHLHDVEKKNRVFNWNTFRFAPCYPKKQTAHRGYRFEKPAKIGNIIPWAKVKMPIHPSS